MQQSNKNIDNILSSLNGIRRAQARPFMHTRVLAKMQEENSFWGRSVSFLGKPLVAICCLAFVVTANVYTVLNTDSSTEQEPVSSSNAVSDIMHNDNYILAVNDINP